MHSSNNTCQSPFTLHKWIESSSLPLLKACARSSPLSIAQCKEFDALIKTYIPNFKACYQYLNTRGDLDKVTSLRSLGSSDFFTKELDDLVLSGEVDFAVHSAKDLPQPLTLGLSICAITKGIDPSDALVIKESIDKLKIKSKLKIATSSVRREKSVLQLLPNATFCDLRGTIEERLKILEDSEIDGVVIAEAALIRLGLTHLKRVTLPGDPPALQGQLAIVAKEDNFFLKQLFSCLDWRAQRPVSVYLGTNSESFTKLATGQVIHLPIIETAASQLQQSQLLLLKKPYSHLIFSSTNGVFFFKQLLEKYPKIYTYLKSAQVIAVGPKTAKAALEFFSNVVSLEEGSCAENFIPYLANISKNAYILNIHSEKARPLINLALKELGLNSESITPYTTNFKNQNLNKLEPDEWIFTSPSTVESFFKQNGHIKPFQKLTCIGHVTEGCLLNYLQSQNYKILTT